MLLDIDHFKSVNDRFGHPAGDEVLRRLSRLLVQELRVTDVAARYGGEEIALLLPHTAAQGALVVASRLRARLAAEPFDIGGETINVTASFGVVCAGHTTSAASLVSAADEALYEAKAAGRNRVVCRTERRDAA